MPVSWDQIRVAIRFGQQSDLVKGGQTLNYSQLRPSSMSTHTIVPD